MRKIAFGILVVLAFDSSAEILTRNTKTNDKKVALAQGACNLLHKQISLVSECCAQCVKEDTSNINPTKFIQMIKPFISAESTYTLQLESSGRSYDCCNPIFSAASLYVAHCNRFQNIVHERGLSYFGFNGDIGNIKANPFVSLSKDMITPIRYAYGVTDSRFSTISDFPYYDDFCKPSQQNIGSIIVECPTVKQLESSIDFVYIDVQKETEAGNLHLGRTKIRRVGQAEICAIGGVPAEFPYIKLDICLPDFSQEWIRDGIDSDYRNVNADGITPREYNTRKRKIENSDDSPKARKRNYEKFCRYHEKSIYYVISRSINNIEYNYDITLR